MSRGVTIAVLVALLAAATAAVAWAQGTAGPAGPAGTGDPAVAQAPPSPPGAPSVLPPLEELRRRLNLTDDQVRRISQILAAHHERTARLRVTLARAYLDVREAMLEPRPDSGRLDALSRRVGEVQGQLLRARLQLMVELKQVLTPEQQAQLRALLAQRALHHRGRR